MCAIWQANSKSRMMFHVKHRRLSESVLNCILFPLYRLMQRGCDSVWIDLLDVIIVGRWRLLKAHRLQNRWIGMFHVKHRSINCVDELVRRIVRGRTCGISPVTRLLMSYLTGIAKIKNPEPARPCLVGVWRKLPHHDGQQEYFRSRKAIKPQFGICKDMLDTQQRSYVHYVVATCLKWHGKIDSFWTTQSAMNCVDDNSHSQASSHILVNVSRETLTSVDWYRM